MGILDWFRTPKPDASAPGGMSRRDFFARVAGRDADAENASAREPTEMGKDAIHAFFVARFPYHSGPVLVPSLRVDETYRLTTEPLYSRSPTAVRIERGRDLLGYVPEDATPDVLERLGRGERLVCRAVRVDPAAELSKVLFVEIGAVEEEAESGPEGASGEAGESAESPGPSAGGADDRARVGDAGDAAPATSDEEPGVGGGPARRGSADAGGESERSTDAANRR